jgi:hypothetical protein
MHRPTLSTASGSAHLAHTNGEWSLNTVLIRRRQAARQFFVSNPRRKPFANATVAVSWTR